MSDRMDQLITLAVRQGFQVWQTAKGDWYFHRGIVTLTAHGKPETAGEWLALIGALRGAGLDIPPR